MAKTPRLKLQTGCTVEVGLMFADLVDAYEGEGKEAKLTVEVDGVKKQYYGNPILLDELQALGLFTGPKNANDEFPVREGKPHFILEKRDGAKGQRQVFVLGVNGAQPSGVARPTDHPDGCRCDACETQQIAEQETAEEARQAADEGNGESANDSLRKSWAKLDLAYGTALAIAYYRQIKTARAAGQLKLVDLATAQAGAATVMIAAEKQGIFDAPPSVLPSLIERLEQLLIEVREAERQRKAALAAVGELGEDDDDDDLPF